jgi:hypothetical protein
MFNFFKKKKKVAVPIQVPKERGTYAFMKHRRGEFLLFLEEDGDVLKFMQLPDRYAISLSKEEYTAGICTNLLEFVEQVPEDVFEVCKANTEILQKV